MRGKTKYTTVVKKRPESARGGSSYILRDSKSGKSQEVRSTAASKQSISKAVSANSKLLHRLAKR